MAEQSVLLGDIINLLRAVHVSALFMSVSMVHLGSNVQSSLGLDQSVRIFAVKIATILQKVTVAAL